MFNQPTVTIVLLLRAVELGSKNLGFWATVCKKVRHMLSDRCDVPPVCPVLSVTLVRWYTVAKRLDGSR